MIYLKKKKECHETLKEKCIEELKYYKDNCRNLTFDTKTLITIENGLNAIIYKYIQYGVLDKRLHVKCTRNKNYLYVTAFRGDCILHDINNIEDLINTNLEK